MINFIQRFITVIIILFSVISISFSQEPVLVQVFYSGSAEECSWEIINTLDNSIVLSGGPGVNNALPVFSYDQTINFIPGEYKFVAYDSYGDGWLATNPPYPWYQVSPTLGIGTGVMNFTDGTSQETPFSVFSSDNVDIGLLSWDSPISSPQMNSTENVTIHVRNYGVDTINGINLSYSINGGFSFITEQYTDSFFPGDSLEYTFLQTANFSNIGTYSCVAFVSTTGDNMTANDTLELSITYFASISTFPWVETFSVWPPQGWSLVGGDSWLSYASTSAFCNFFFWNEGSAEMITPPLDISSPASLSFDWSSTLDNSYSLDDEMLVYISADYGVTWDLVLEKSGVDLNSFDGATTQSPGTFISENIDLTPYQNEIIYVKFVGSSDLGSNLYVDNVSVDLNPNIDLAVINWVYPPEAACGLGQSENIIVKIKNTGSTVISSFNLAYSIGAFYTFESVNLSVNPVYPGDTIEHVFATPADFSTFGTYNCQVLIMNPGDNVLSNDAINVTVKSLDVINNFPFIEDFESGDSDFFKASSNDYANAEIFIEGSNTAIKMEGGPLGYGWIGTSQGTSSYEAWDINISHQSSLFSCTVDATGLSTLELLFDLKQFYKYGPKYSYFRVLINGQQMADDNGTLDFHPQTSAADPYSTIRFDLSAFAGTQLDIRFEASNKLSSFSYPPGNVALVDNIIIQEIPVPDAAIISLDSPVSTCNLSSSEILEIQVQNNGGEAINSYDLSYSLNGSPFVVNSVSTAIPSGGILNYSYPQSIDLSVVGQYLITIAVSLPGDMVAVNDTITFLVENMSQQPVSIMGLSTDYCIYDQYTVLSGNPIAGVFTGPGIMGDIFDPLLAGTGIHEITYSVYDQASGCTSVAIETVTVNGSEVSFAGLYTGPTLVPVFVEVFYDATWVNEQTWEILDDAGNVILSSSSGTSSNGYSYNGILNLPFGNYNFVAYDTFGDGWDASWYNITPDFGVGTGIQTYDIPQSQWYVHQQTTGFVVGGQSYMCYGDPVVTLIGTPVAGIFTGPGINGSTFDPSVAGIGSHSITYTYTDGLGCTGTDIQVIIVEELPIVDLGPDVIVCEGTTVTLDAGIAYSYVWDDGSTSQTYDVFSSGLYSVTVSSENGCEGVDQLNILANPLPPVDFGADINLCNGDTFILDASVGSTYLWNDGSDLNTLEVVSSGVYSVTVTSSEGCLGIDEIEMIFNTVNVNLGVNQNLCVGDTTILDPGSFSSYIWSTGSTNQTIPVYLPNLYSVTVQDVFGCIDEDEIAVYVHDLPVIDLGPDMIIEDTVIILEPGIFSSYLWSDGSSSMIYVVDGYSLPAGPNEIWVEVSNSAGCYNSDTIYIEAYQTDQIVELEEGWSIISTYIDPIFPILDSVFAAVSSEIQIMKNGDGLVYWPIFNLNLIGDMVIGEGYQISMSSLQYLVVTGEQVIPETTIINIPFGWSIIGYLRTTPAPTDTMLASIVSDIVLVKAGSGLVYWPGFQLNMIGNMIPGDGYQILMADSALFSYPSNTPVGSKMFNPTNFTQYFSNIKNTGHNMTLCIPISTWDIKPRHGDEIGVFTELGTLVGGSVYESDNCIITIWGDDPYNPEINGLQEAEELSLRLWNKESGIVSTISILDFEKGSEFYSNNEISIVGKIVSSLEDEYYLGQNYPNPFPDYTTIEFYLPENTHVNISVYSSLGKYIRNICNKEYTLGSHSIDMTGDLPAGVYYYRFVSDKFMDVKQFYIIEK